MTAFFMQTLSITAAMSVLIAVLFVLSRIAGAKFTAKCRYIIWAVVILRLALPISLGEGWLVQVELPAEETLAEEVQNVTPETQPIAKFTPPETTDPAPAWDFTQNADTSVKFPTVAPDDLPTVEIVPENIPEFTETLPEMQAEPIVPEEPISEQEPVKLTDILNIAAQVYVIGVVVYFTVRIVSHIIYINTVNRTKKRVSQKLYEEYHALCDSMKIGRHPALYSSEMADSPMLCGYFRPRVILPPSVAEDERVRGILAHELTHYKRGDIWLKLIAMLAEAIHWFNPLVHFASRRCEQEMELACDEAVLCEMDEDARVTYGYAMLDIVKMCAGRRNTLTTQYSPRKAALKERFENILDTSHKRRGVLIIVLSVILCAAASLAISCTVETPETVDDESSQLEDESEGIEKYNDAKESEESLNDELDSYLGQSAERLYAELRELYTMRCEYVSEEEELQVKIASTESELELLENRRTAYLNSPAATLDKNSDSYKALEAQLEALEAQLVVTRAKIEENNNLLREIEYQREYVSSQIAECLAQLKATAPDMLYERYGKIVMLPDEYFDSVTTVPAADLETNEIAKFYQTSVMDQGIGWLFSIVRHTPEEVLTSEENQGGISYFAHDDFYWYAIQTPTDLQVDVTSQEHTDEYNRLSEMMDGVKSSFKLANDLTIADNTYAEHMVKTYYSQDSHTLYDSMTSADDWNDVIDAPAVREDAAALVNKLLAIYRNGGSEEELDKLFTHLGPDRVFPEGISVPDDLTSDEIPSMFSLNGQLPMITIPLDDGWEMYVLMTTLDIGMILDWAPQYLDYREYKGWDLTMVDVLFENTEDDEAETTADDLINVISNDGGMLTNAVVLPMYGEDSSYRSFRFDDRYSIYLTYNYTRENGNIASYSNIRLYIIDGQSGKIAYQTALETEYLPDWISYTENGCRLHGASVEDGVYTVHCGYLVEQTDSGFSVTEAEFEHLPYNETICRTPTSGVYAAEVIEDGSGDGGIDIIYPGGTVKRILENIMIEEVDEIKINELNRVEYDLSDVRGYTPIGFLDDEHLVYAIGGWEWHFGYGIYNITTGETVLSGKEAPLAVHDGVLFLEDSEIASDGSYETLSSKYYAVTVDGEKKLIASTDEADGVFVLPMDKYTVFEGSTWQMFATGRFNGWNHSDVASDYMTVEVYSPDFSEKLAEIEYHHNYTLVENFITVGNSVTVVVPAVVEETAEISIPDYVKFPSADYPNMTDDVNDYKTLGVEKDSPCYQMAKEYLADADDYIVWFDGSGIHIILNRSTAELEYKFIRETDGGDIRIVDSFSDAYYLYNRALELGHDGSSLKYQAIRAMLMSDGKFMESLTREYSGNTEELFSDFKATMHTLNMTPADYPSDGLALTLTVEQSEIERLPVGTYTIIVNLTFDGLVIERADEDFVIKPDPTTDAEEAIWTWLRAVGMAEIPLDGDMTAEELTNFKRAVTEYACRHADGTIESVKNAVKTCFGSEDYFAAEQLMQIDDTHYGVGGHGAARYSYDWLGTTENEDGSVSVKMRFYADVNKFVKAKDIEYIIRAVGEDIYGQTIYAFEECNIVEDYGCKSYFMWT